MSTNTAPQTVALSEIVCDARCQSRVSIDKALVEEYAQMLQDGVSLPPVSVIETPDGFFVYDGFHRVEAHRVAERDAIDVDAQSGTILDAIEKSARANATHGKRRTREDTKRAIETLINVRRERKAHWGNVEIAKKAGVSESTVRRVRAELASSSDDEDNIVEVTRGGKTFTIDSSKIGKRSVDADGVIVEDDDEILPDFEIVDPTDPAAFVMPSNGTSAQTRPQTPSFPITVAAQYQRYLTDDATARALAQMILSHESVGVAELVGDAIARELATRDKTTGTHAV